MRMYLSTNWYCNLWISYTVANFLVQLVSSGCPGMALGSGYPGSCPNGNLTSYYPYLNLPHIRVLINNDNSSKISTFTMGKDTPETESWHCH